MPLNTLSTPTFDTSGFVELPVTDETNDGEMRRRVARVATLDGGAVVNDGGYTEADRVLSLAWVPNNATREAAVKRMIQLYQQIQVATREGVYLVALESYTPGADESVLRALVLRKLSN
jgi:hypothetical protein